MSNTALVTGASSGIGWELARCCAVDGHRVVLVARSEDKLRELATMLNRDHGTETIVVSIDLSDPDAPRKLADRLLRDGVEIDWLFNNAGFANAGRFVLNELESEMDLLRVNASAPMALCHLLGAGMILRGRGRVLNVASTAAFVPGPFMANYYASKAYLVSLSLALREEWKTHGVMVSTLCPGPTDTAFFENAGAQTTPIAEGSGGGLQSPRKVAEAGYRGMLAGKALIVPGMANKMGAFATRFVPRSFLARVTKGYNRSDDLTPADRVSDAITEA